MKRLVAIAVAVAFLAAVAPSPALSGEREWATAGKILTGIIGVTILGNAIAQANAYPPPVYAPRAVYPPEEVWVQGYYVNRIERRWIPGHWEFERNGRMVNGDARYGTRHKGNRKHPARRIWVPGYYRNVEVSVWIPGHWERRG